MLTADAIWSNVDAVRRHAPVVHNITNFVVMNSTANALLSLGASPVMAHAEPEVADMVGIAGALVINIGTLSPPWVHAMHIAMRRASERGVPIVLDPVGVGATAYRTQTAHELIADVAPTIVRGNASEIKALVASAATTRGVDSMDESDTAVDAAQHLHDNHGFAVAVTGATDYIIGGPEPLRIDNGHQLMSRVTGLGCTTSALCGAMAAVDDVPWRAAASAVAVSGICGELAAERAAGPGSLQVSLLDALHGLTADQIADRLKVSPC
jgi:hydroxyethylthiazole kinase